MSSKNSGTIILLIALAVVGLVFVFGIFGGEKSKFDWKETYDKNSRQPYGTALIFKLLENYFPGNSVKIIEDDIRNTLTGNERNANYVLLGQAFLFDSLDQNRLLEFVANGNNAFFSSQSVPFDFLKKIHPDSCRPDYYLDYPQFTDSVASAKIIGTGVNDTTTYHFQYMRNGRVYSYYEWAYMNSYFFCDSTPQSPVPLGYYPDSVDLLFEHADGWARFQAPTFTNFAKIKYGDGTIFLHTMPLAFTNFHLRKPQSLAYAEKIFSHLQEGDIYWDAKHQISLAMSRRRNYGSSPTPPKQLEDSPLAYVLAQPPLAWAWYILVAMAMLYLIFYSKRRQRIIPVVEANANTSLEFVGTIGKLYFQKGNPRLVALQKMKFLQGYVRDRYHLPVGDWNEPFIQQLHLKSEAPRALLKKIALMYHNIQSSQFASEQTLMDFHHLLEEFYRVKK